MLLFMSYAVTVITSLMIGHLFAMWWLKNPTVGYSEADIPDGCELVQIGDEFAFKIGDRFADINDTCFTWKKPQQVQRWCMTSSKSLAIRSGMEAYRLLEATK